MERDRRRGTGQDREGLDGVERDRTGREGRDGMERDIRRGTGQDREGLDGVERDGTG